MTSVRVATFQGPGAPPVIREVPKPEVPAKAALIRIGACGVCGTDLHILNDHWPAFEKSLRTGPGAAKAAKKPRNCSDSDAG